jgi:tRNA-splicing ligase RtcB
MKVINSQGKKPIFAWTEGVPVEDEAMRQLDNIAGLPFIFRHVAVMPDVHFGIGATVGSVIATKGAIVPAAVGVDIGCGMNAIRLSLKASDLPESLKEIRHQIERDVPVGFNVHKREQVIDQNLKSMPNFAGMVFDDVLLLEHLGYAGKAPAQLGTLGGGNHFIELCLDENQDVWAMLHSGSRGIGNAIGRHFIELAKRDMERYYINLPDQDLAYLPEGSENFKAYCRMVSWAQRYAAANRMVMMDLVLAALRRHLPAFEVTQEAINCHHNYISHENHFGENVWVTRKGAVSARQDQLGIIPGSMGAKSYIVRGKGSPDSFCSCSHGAGRVMSRNKAKGMFTRLQHEEATRGVECRKDEGVLDETPAAYKDIDAVMEAQQDLVEVVHTLKQVLCVKG